MGGSTKVRGSTIVSVPMVASDWREALAELRDIVNQYEAIGRHRAKKHRVFTHLAKQIEASLEHAQ